MKQNINSSDQTFEQLKNELEQLKYQFESLNTTYQKTLLDHSKAINVLEEREKSNRNLFYNAPINYHSLDSGGCILIANPTWLSTLGYTHEEVAGHHFSEFISQESSELFSNKWLPCLLEEGQIHDVEFEMFHKDGTRLHVSLDGKLGKNDKAEAEQTHFIWTDITRRKKAEKLQSENEISYRELFNNVTDAIYIQDEDGTFLDINEGAVKMYGYPHELLIGKNPLFVSAPGKNDLEAIAAMIKRAYEGEPQIFEFWGLRANGEIFPKEVRVVTGTYFGKKVNIAMAQDITERKLAEIALQESERKFRNLIELAVDGILIGSPEGVILEANTYMQNLTGRSLENLVGINISELFSTQILKNNPLRFDLLLKGQTVFGARDILRPDGKLIPIEMHTKMMPDGTYQSIYRNVTERKRSEEILKESEERYRELFEASPDAIILADIETGMLIDANPAACSLLGYTLNNIRELNQSMIHPARYEKFVVKLFNRHASKTLNNKDLLPMESMILRSDGTEVPVEVLSNTITINGRQIIQGVFRNITERMQAREDLMKAKEKAEASDKLKSAFLQNITHELRTPLNGIIGFSEMITHSDNSAEDRIEFNKMIRKSSARLINTITGYMDISLIVSGLAETHLMPLSLNKFLNKITAKTLEICNLRNLDLDIIQNFPDEDIEIITDKDLLEKIFFQFIDNAVKFTKKGSITIEYERKAGYHQFCISDTGTGIPDESMPAIFEMFRQVDLSPTRSYEGSGLGLSIAQGYVKLLGGEIRVESEINQGSKFFFTLPSEADTSPGTAIKIKPSLPAQRTILVAEDDDSNYKYLEIVLKREAFKVLRAKTGFETLEICGNYPDISLLLTDMKMPGMDGLESTRLIREILPELPIIGLSGLITAFDEDAARQAGCNDYIVKPVSKVILLETINKFFPR